MGGVLSSIATLAVIPANPHSHYLSFVERSSRGTNSTITAANQDLNTTNVGVLNGGGHFKQNNSGNNGIGAGTYPVFSTFVPVGPYAPDPRYNQFSLNMGDVRYTNFPSGLVFSMRLEATVFPSTVSVPLPPLPAPPPS